MPARRSGSSATSPALPRPAINLTGAITQERRFIAWARDFVHRHAAEIQKHKHDEWPATPATQAQQCAANQRTLLGVHEMARMDHPGGLPGGDGLQHLLLDKSYLKTLPLCPGEAAARGSFPNHPR